jgi:hypothetical protein
VTDIELTIPLQPQWSERDLQQFRNDQEGVQIGSLLAWLGHLNVLRWYFTFAVSRRWFLLDANTS